MGTDETDLKHANERRVREARFQLNRQTADAKRSIDDAKRAARREIDQQARNARTAAGGGSSFFGLGTGSSTQNVDDQLLVWVLPVAAVALVPLAVGHLAALLVSGGWPSYPISEAPGIVGRFATNPGDPAEAWAPVNAGAPVPAAGPS